MFYMNMGENSMTICPHSSSGNPSLRKPSLTDMSGSGDVVVVSFCDTDTPSARFHGLFPRVNKAKLIEEGTNTLYTAVVLNLKNEGSSLLEVLRIDIKQSSSQDEATETVIPPRSFTLYNPSKFSASAIRQERKDSRIFSQLQVAARIPESSAVAEKLKYQSFVQVGTQLMRMIHGHNQYTASMQRLGG
ncbi:hypothetical protein TGGT1_254635 [Toxoplasma gondii GT1]|uniref:Uncharacterized protein n=3 Tax=Toxoplasma gondii TaxID=5811 RepID=S7VVN6_TOXGG|nr:hypothetical protein TGGT1_254635 [Toxoplasma gondii GT1]KAF4645265.1 hypothetical protein TGRH88_003690 [Toxoplasma gondii]KFG53062.1 hypothetical protein TGFOU_254635 [Toxoplasma gondii FOU]